MGQIIRNNILDLVKVGMSEENAERITEKLSKLPLDDIKNYLKDYAEF